MSDLAQTARPTFYLTTPIYYVNARPHIGHAYSTIVGDVIARRHRLLGEDVFFLTGTDEHGQKIERSAAAAGVPPQEFADQVSKTFSDLWERMGITNDGFIRTTSECHKVGVQKLFTTLKERGAIYLDTYTGQYCVSDEAFVDVGPGERCPECGNLTETITESNYYFRLSEYGERIASLIESGELAILPETRRNEVLSFVKGGLKDLSISRTSFKWGIPVPGDESHVIYVWLDALANYMTAIGYGSDDESEFRHYWPADVHLVGKEIIRFHCVYWPAFLMAAGLPLPKSIVANGWLLFEESKMSKSKGNVVRTETILDAFGSLKPELSKKEQDLFGADVLRYFLLREIPFGQDGSFSFDALVTRYNADLANGYGNLVSRTLNMIHKYNSGEVPADRPFPSDFLLDKEVNWNLVSSDKLKSAAIDAPHDFGFRVERYNFNGALSGLLEFVASMDLFLTEQAPWKTLQGLPPEITAIRRDKILYTVAESIRILTALLHPVMPYATGRVWEQLGLGDIEVAAQGNSRFPSGMTTKGQGQPQVPSGDDNKKSNGNSGFPGPRAEQAGMTTEGANGELTSELKDLQWGGLKPGTKLGVLAPVFPRADKGLVQVMSDVEANKVVPKSAFSDEVAPAAVVTDATDPAAGPRTGALVEEGAGAHVAGSAAVTTERVGTPSHTEAAASGIFAASAHLSDDGAVAKVGHAMVPDTPQIAIDDFVKVDLRVARIVVAERIPKADKLLRLEVDLGYETRQILSGIAEWYTPEELIGRKIVIIANLAPRKMRGLESQGMLLAASEGENGKPVLATFGEEIAVGTRLR
jgi:methionyl-tRNA synthetase